MWRHVVALDAVYLWLNTLKSHTDVFHPHILQLHKPCPLPGDIIKRIPNLFLKKLTYTAEMLLVSMAQVVSHPVPNGSYQVCWWDQDCFQRWFHSYLEQQGADLLTAGWWQTRPCQHVHSDSLTAWNPSGTRWDPVLSKVSTQCNMD